MRFLKRAMAQRAIAAANSVLGNHSPSKVFFGIGAFVGQGFANGISDYAYLAEQSSGAMADSVITLVGEALHNIEELNDDFSPVITPIIDLSNVSKGLPKINFYSISHIISERLEGRRWHNWPTLRQITVWIKPLRRLGGIWQIISLRNRHQFNLHKITILLKLCRGSISIDRQRIKFRR